MKIVLTRAKGNMESSGRGNMVQMFGSNPAGRPRDGQYAGHAHTAGTRWLTEACVFQKELEIVPAPGHKSSMLGMFRSAIRNFELFCVTSPPAECR